MRKLLAGVAVAIAAAAGWAVPADAETSDGSVVRTDAGAVRGVVGDDHRLFQGVPYAKPPVDELRWRSPQRPERWTGVRDATKPATRCAQIPPGGQLDGAEDCLYLNVTTPRSNGHRLKPVIVWIHGGGLFFGSANDYDARRLVKGADVVVVSPNYRMNVFGFLGHRALADSGGFGLEDQQAALRWVRRNAAAFGGDPRRVTIMGESGGAQAVCMHLTAPGSRGLFDGAIMQSGSCSMSFPLHWPYYGHPAGGPLVSMDEAERRGAALATELGCTDPKTAVACLRTKSPTELVSTWQGQRYQTPAAYGSRVLPLDPRIALARGKFHRVPVITGTTRDESTVNTSTLPQPFTGERYRAVLAESYGADAPAIVAEYPSAAYVSPGAAWAAQSTDRTWTCPQLRDARLLARRTPTYLFEFADQNAPTGWFQFPDDVPSGAFHSADLAYFFDVAGFDAPFTPAQERLSADLMTYWSQFAATGSPNGGALPWWSRLHRSNAHSLAPSAMGPVDIATAHHCSFWAGLSP
jgi:para-nitrobenzyl esterase